MGHIELPKRIDLTEIQKLNQKFTDSNLKSIDVKMPSEFLYQGFGIVPLVILFFSRWLRYNVKGEIMIDIDVKDQKSLEHFSSSYLGYSLLSLAWKHKEILDKNRIPLKGQLKVFTEKMHRKIDFLEQLPNDELLIPIFDHYSKSKGLSHWFYNNNFDFAASPERLSNTTYRIFQELGKIFKTKIAKNLNEILEDIEIIIWELLKNTHDHAIKDYLNQNDLSPNIRGIYFKIHRSSKNNFVKNSKENSGLLNYFQNVLENGDNFLLEISVFDTGPGLVKRFLGKDWNDSIAPNDEVKIIKKCLCKGISSTDGLKGTNKGFGLNNVLITLSSKRGFFTIKTGKVSLYRDLSKSPHFETTDFKRIELQDVETNSPSNFSMVDETTGTVVTMFYPLK